MLYIIIYIIYNVIDSISFSRESEIISLHYLMSTILTTYMKKIACQTRMISTIFDYMKIQQLITAEKFEYLPLSKNHCFLFVFS